ncbi:MAG: hypothetical protein H5U32_05740 [Pseudomonas balearica]|nr:hypothetical protein [Stutzerimonas balearica]
MGLGFAGAAGFVEPGACFQQLVLGLAALLFQLRQGAFSLGDRLPACLVEMNEQTVGEFLQQLQRRIERFLLRGHHDASLPNDAPILDGP